MKALSIRQPWAWLIIKGHKDIENRSWPTAFRGRVLVHAAKGMTTSEYVDADFFVCGGGIKLPRPRDLLPAGRRDAGGEEGRHEGPQRRVDRPLAVRLSAQFYGTKGWAHA